MSLTFNSNNNYSVEIITESNLGNISQSNGPGEGIQFSADTNTPFVTLKIIPTNPQSQPVLASNIKINDIIPDFAWNAMVNYNTNGICMPPPPPHDANSSLQHVTSIGVTSTCQALGFTGFSGNSNERQQGPYSAQNDSATQANQIANDGVSWSEIILIEVYEDDNGDLVNDNHSPDTIENYNEWAMWVGPSQTAIYNNKYPIYVKAFVFLSFDTGGPSALTNNVTLNLDFDEVPPIFGCNDPAADNYDSTATIDDGSCTYPVPGCTDPGALNYEPLATVDDGSCTYPAFGPGPGGFMLAGPQGTAFQGQGTPNIHTFLDTGYPNNPGQIAAMMMFTITVPPAINTLPNSSGVTYEIMSFRKIENHNGTTFGAQTDIERTTNMGLMTPPYGVSPIPPFNISNYFSSPSNIVTAVPSGTPMNVTANVLFGNDVIIDGVIMPHDPNNIGHFGYQIDVAIRMTDSGAITHTYLLSTNISI